MKFEDVKVGIPYFTNEDDEVIFFAHNKDDNYIDGIEWNRIDQEFFPEKINDEEDLDFYLEYFRPVPENVMQTTLKEVFENEV